MAHMIERRADGQDSFVGAREPAWHRLGKVYEDQDGLKVDTVLTDLDAGRIVVTENVQAPLITPDGVSIVTDDTKKMTVRLRSTGPVPLGVVAQRYQVVQEAEAFGFLDNIVDSGEALISSAGLLDGGRRAFCCMKLPSNVLIGGVDEVDMYLFIALSHDGTLAVTAAATPIRVVCQNTLTYGLARAAHVWKVRHTSKAVMKVAEARRALQLTHAYEAAWQEEAEALIKVKFTKKQYEGIVGKLFPAPDKDAAKQTITAYEKTHSAVMGLWSADTQSGIKNTAWGALNALYEYGDWFRSTRGGEDADADAQRFATSLFSGHGAVRTLADYKNTAMELVKARAGL